MTPIKPPRHLSASSLNLWNRCPYGWYCRYVKKISTPPGAPLLFGDVIAHSLEVLHNGGDSLDYCAKRHAEKSELLRRYGGVLLPDADYAVTLLAMYRKRPYSGWPERPFSLEIPKIYRVPLSIVGFMDLEEDTHPIVDEFKTSRAIWTQARVDSEIQASIYDWAYTELHGRAPDFIRYIVGSTFSPGWVELETRPTKERFEKVMAQAQALWRAIKTGPEAFDERCGSCDFCKLEEARREQVA